MGGLWSSCVAMDAESRWLVTARVTLVISLSLIWIGLIPRGWEKVDVSGGASVAYYGLWWINFKAGKASYIITYASWDDHQSDTAPYSRVQGTRACAVFALAGSVIQLLTYFRSWCIKEPERKRKLMIICTVGAFLSFFFNILSLIVWKTISNEAWQVWCNANGCSQLPASTISHTVNYSWGFMVIRALSDFLGVLAVLYLTTTIPVPSDGRGSRSGTGTAVVPAPPKKGWSDYFKRDNDQTTTTTGGGGNESVFSDVGPTQTTTTTASSPQPSDPSRPSWLVGVGAVSASLPSNNPAPTSAAPTTTGTSGGEKVVSSDTPSWLQDA